MRLTESETPGFFYLHNFMEESLLIVGHLRR